jgi:hypothetical protein
MKTKRIWSPDTAQKVAEAKAAKYGKVFITVPMNGGGFAVVAIEDGEWKVAAA